MNVYQLIDILNNNKISKMKAKVKFEDNDEEIYDLSVSSTYYGAFKNKVLELKVQNEDSIFIAKLQDVINCCEKNLWGSCDVKINCNSYDGKLADVKDFIIQDSILYLLCDYVE